MSAFKVKIKYLRHTPKRAADNILSANDLVLLGDKATATLMASIEKIKNGKQSVAEEEVITKWL